MPRDWARLETRLHERILTRSSHGLLLRRHKSRRVALLVAPGPVTCRYGVGETTDELHADPEALGVRNLGRPVGRNLQLPGESLPSILVNVKRFVSMSDRAPFAFRATRVFLYAGSLVSLLGTPAAAQVGYGYQRAEDPLVLSIKRVILEARQDRWDLAIREFTKLKWQFDEFKNDLGIEIRRQFRGALEARSIPQLSHEIARVMYYAVVQKFYWNRAENCERYVPAKSRVEAALFYYDEILSIGVRSHDMKAKTELDRTIQVEFKLLRKTIGSSGVFGIGARSPEPRAFAKTAQRIVALLRVAYPTVETSPAEDGAESR